MARPVSPRARRTVLAALCALIASSAVAAFVVVPRPGWTTSDITTGDGLYTDLTPRVYDAPPAMVAAFTKQAATRLLNWRVQQTTGDTNQVNIQVPSGPFTDDLTVTITPEGNNARVVIRSHSQKGPADFGRNADHIRKLQAAMDDKLPAASP